MLKGPLKNDLKKLKTVRFYGGLTAGLIQLWQPLLSPP